MTGPMPGVSKSFFCSAILFRDWAQEGKFG